MNNIDKEYEYCIKNHLCLACSEKAAKNENYCKDCLKMMK